MRVRCYKVLISLEQPFLEPNASSLMGCMESLGHSVAFLYHMDQESVSQVSEVIACLIESPVDPVSDQLFSRGAISGLT